MRFYKFVILCISCLIFALNISAKWRAVYNETIDKTVYYDIFDDPILKDYPIFPLNKLIAPTGVGLCITKYGKFNKKEIIDSLNLKDKKYHFFIKHFLHYH